MKSLSVNLFAKSRKILKKPTQGPTENYRSEYANTGVLQVQWDKEIAQNYADNTKINIVQKLNLRHWIKQFRNNSY